MLKFSQVHKKDIPFLAKIYANAYNKEGESWNTKKSKEIVMYRYKKIIKIKVMHDDQIVGAFFSDVKPLFFGNILNDGDVIIDPKYQKLGIGKQLFIYGIEYAIKKFHVVGWDFYTFKDSYQYNRYKRIGFSDSNKWILLSGNIDEVLKKLKKNSLLCKKK
ncbi:MAG TPA: GNAT family N-acetyltransferase [Candidatus Absconditabacterales bacterium]|nr:GNAT family N-acetyltransferase [Candidatus Absconditabacterales bacterium]